MPCRTTRHASQGMQFDGVAQWMVSGAPRSEKAMLVLQVGGARPVQPNGSWMETTGIKVAKLEKATAIGNGEGPEVFAWQEALKKAKREATELPRQHPGGAVRRTIHRTSPQRIAQLDRGARQRDVGTPNQPCSVGEVEDRSTNDTAGSSPRPQPKGSVGSCATGTSPSCETSSRDALFSATGGVIPANANQNPQGIGRLDGRQACGVEGCHGVPGRSEGPRTHNDVGGCSRENAGDDKSHHGELMCARLMPLSGTCESKYCLRGVRFGEASNPGPPKPGLRRPGPPASQASGALHWPKSPSRSNLGFIS